MVKNNRIKALEHGRKVDEQMQPIHEKLQEMTEDHNKKLDQVNLQLETIMVTLRQSQEANKLIEKEGLTQFPGG